MRSRWFILVVAVMWACGSAPNQPGAGTTAQGGDSDFSAETLARPDDTATAADGAPPQDADSTANTVQDSQTQRADTAVAEIADIKAEIAETQSDALADAKAASLDAANADADPADPAETDANPPTSDAVGDSGGTKAKLKASTQVFNLNSAAFAAKPGQPSVLVYVPHNFDPTPPVGLVVYLHGWYNCIAVCSGEINKPCTPGGAARTASKIIAQFEAGGRNALLVLPEMAFDQGSSDPGNLGKAGAFKALMTELLPSLTPTLGTLTTQDIGHIAVASHSGAYLGTGLFATTGGLPVHEVWLLDSLYGSQTTFKNWIAQDLASFDGSTPKRRFFDVYTDSGGTMANSKAFAATVAQMFAAGSPTVVNDTTTATWPAATYGHGVLFKHSALSHDGVTLYYFGQLIKTAGQFAERPGL